ncbi:bifunctional ligase/repressor BirA [Sporomusaceae bacterium FL31]|nr:bifunctional ligase/repressor BirA [Sporomusaceae bacterium FL31]GCE34785.1 bifunctional ligase/repressor BirA [Sporomusaceae bacterium]
MRTRILNLLRQRSGEYLSGEEIARQLDVSRTAVWKHMQELKQEGYAIDAHSRRGYSLRQAPDLLLPAEIQAAVKTKILGRDIRYFTHIDSTNNEAKKIAAAGAAEGTIVVSESQNSGRGRLSRGWYSPEHSGIWLSVILRPAFSPQEAPKCTLLAAVAITRAIRGLCKVDCGIKWPNDILYDGKKLVGILTEMSAEMDAINHIVIGMGINVNIAQQDFPVELQDIATSLSIILGQPISRIDLLCEILLQLEELYIQAIDTGFSGILNEWRKYSITIGQTVDVIGVNRKFTGIAVDIDEDGALLVETDNGRQKVIAGDVSIRPKKTS